MTELKIIASLIAIPVTYVLYLFTAADEPERSMRIGGAVFCTLPFAVLMYLFWA